MNIEKTKQILQELPSHVELIAVSKTRTKEEVDEAYHLGCRTFGENKVQELVAKYDPKYTWHLIGHLQRNKVKDAVKYADMIESLDSMRLAQEIEKQCAKIDKVMPVLVEVNISQEENKTGIAYEECINFIKECQQFPHLDIQGLMCVGPLTDDQADIEACFESMHTLFQEAQESFGPSIRILSMGMSDDYELAIKHGSTMVRLGTILFGKRDYTI